MAELSKPNFVDRNPQEIEREIIAEIEAELDRTLYPAQPESLFARVIAFRETIVREAIQYTGEQNLVNFAEGVALDQLGVMLDTSRLQASAALTTLRFTLPTPLLFDLLIPQNTRAAAGTVQFGTTENALLIAGNLFVDISAQCTEMGEQGNGFEIGAIAQLVDPIGYNITVANTTKSNSGAAIESDDRYRERIKLAPNKLSNAGTKPAYEYHARSADNTIIAVAIDSPLWVKVDIYPLTVSGLPSPELLAKVDNYFNSPDNKIRPLCDEVTVSSPVEYQFIIEANITLFANNDAQLVRDNCQLSINEFANTLRQKLGVDIVRSQIAAKLQLNGVYKVDLIQPSLDKKLLPYEWANCTSININFVGVEDG